MRELKFRAWDKKGNCMVDWGCMTQTAFNNSKMNFMYDLFCGHRLDVEIMQFTGLVDKNGKEIYEGDILSSEDAHHDCHGHCFLNVEWNNFKNGWGFNLYVITDYKMIIIGNIYENPELLEIADKARGDV